MKRQITIILFAMILAVVAVSLASAEDPNVCCQKTTSGLFCQDVPASQCAPNSLQVPSACESTSYCKKGVCYDSNEGTCLDNVPQLVCNSKGGTWSETAPAQCDLGCCVLGDQASFVSLVRCKKLSSFLGLQTNFKQEIRSESQCILSVRNQEKGACVFDSDFERTCKFTTRSECDNVAGDNSTGGDFYPGKLCSAEELATNCGPTDKTSCLPGKDEVYFLDSCGNTANIYDSSKLKDKTYWSDVIDKSEACNPNSPNANSRTCGNCNYAQGSFCRQTTSTDSVKPSYGDFICKSLNCENTENGKSYKHGESWCVYDDEGKTGVSDNSVGSRFYKHICENGQEVVEQCADFRQEECIEDSIETSDGEFSQAACRVNRWQDCLAQTSKSDCENTDRRDCRWTAGTGYNGQNVTQTGLCLPKNTPGLNFWDDEQSTQICAQANTQCVVTFSKGLFGGEECESGCDCLTAAWNQKQIGFCKALGDCGPKVNWDGQEGYKDGYELKTVG